MDVLSFYPCPALEEQSSKSSSREVEAIRFHDRICKEAEWKHSDRQCQTYLAYIDLRCVLWHFVAWAYPQSFPLVDSRLPWI